MQILKKIKNNSDYKRLFENFISLSILQGLNYILPLVTFPYLVRVLGVEKFGLLSFATATIAYFQILTDYGFNLSATREVAIYRDNKEKLQEIFSSVMIIKFGLLLVSFILLTILVFSINKFRQDWLVYYLSFGMVLGQVLFPVWFFQGMERMRYITILNVVAKSIFTIAIFVFVKSQSDYWKVPLLNSIGFLFAGIISLLLLFRYYSLKIKYISFYSLLTTMKNSFYMFITTIGVVLYTATTTFLLGLFTNNQIVGYFASANKLIEAVKGLFQPIFQSLYPYVSNKVSKDRNNGLYFIKKILKYTLIITSIVTIFLFLFAKYIVLFILGEGYNESIKIFKLLSIIPLITGIGNVLGVLTMMTLKLEKQLQKIVLFAGLINIIVSIVFVPIVQHLGSAIAIIISETFVTLACLLYLHKVKIL